MKQLLGSNHLDETIFKQLFLQGLPHHVQRILASSRDDMKVTQLADSADRVIDVGSTSTVSAVSMPSSAPSYTCSPDLSQLRQQVDRLKYISGVTTQLQHERGRSPNRRPHCSDRQRSRNSSEKLLCLEFIPQIPTTLCSDSVNVSKEESLSNFVHIT